MKSPAKAKKMTDKEWENSPMDKAMDKKMKAKMKMKKGGPVKCKAGGCMKMAKGGGAYCSMHSK